MTTDHKVCERCGGSGFSDKVNRHVWAMEPAHLLCETCGGRGWVTEDGKMILISTEPIDPDNWVYRRFTEQK